MKIYELSGAVIEKSIEIHRALGPGLLESVYKRILINFGEEVLKNGIHRLVNNLDES